jgi:hypothetical protein
MSALFDLSGLPDEARADILQTTRYRDLFSRFPDRLLGVDNNAKTIKGQKYGFRTAILYLTPAMGSGVNLCPMARIAQCDVACLNTAGRGGFLPNQMARLRKTLYFLQYRDMFIAQLGAEIAEEKVRARADGVILLVRLNGTSDVEWERIAPELFAEHSDVQFYDYTKIPNRRGLPPNYDLTYSYSGVADYQRFVDRAIAQGMRIAVVFRHRESIPESFRGMSTVDGDDSDIRHIDPPGVVVALYAKGAAKRDATGFVVQN